MVSSLTYRFKKTALHLIFFIVCFTCGFSQKQANIWYFGRNAGLDFNAGSPTLLFNGQLNTAEGCASISDKNGNLLFYTDGIDVWDKSHQLMSNGTGLMGDSSSAQAAIITPYVGDKNKYFIFTTDGTTAANNGPLGKWDGLKYSVVDITLNGGLGGIIPGWKNRSLTDSTSERVTAALHANGIDYWVITKKHFSNTFYAYLVSCNGIDTANPVVTTIGTFPSAPAHGVGYLKASHKSTAIVCAVQQGYSELFDFNNSTGQLSNSRVLSTNTSGHYGASFSPNDSIVYISGRISPTQGRIWRYQRYSANISATEKIDSLPATIMALQIAPDGKIYFCHFTGSFATSDSLGVITNPDNFTSPGTVFNYLYLGGQKSSSGLPNNFDAGLLKPQKAFAGNDTLLCISTSVQLGDSSIPGISYFWTPSSGLNNPSISNPVTSTTTSITYVVGAYNQCDTIYDTVNVIVSSPTAVIVPFSTTICTGDTVLLTASGGNSYLWSTGTTNQSINVNPLNSTPYSVTVSTGACNDTASVYITVIPTPVAVISGDTLICQGETVLLSASGGTNYLWNTGAGTDTISVSPTLSSTYSAIVYNGACADTGTIYITVNSVPLLSVTGDDTICSGAALSLTASGGTNYLWSTGSTGNTMSNTPSVSQTYSVIAFNGNCTDTANVNITVNPAPVATITGNTSICTGDSAALTAAGGGQYLWSNGLQTSTIVYTASAVYSLTVTNNNCTDTTSVAVTVYNIPLANAGPDTTICHGNNLTLLASGGNSYTWSTGANTPTIIVNADMNTIYSVTVSNGNCTQTDEVTITVIACDCNNIFIPNAFSPNGDGQNDELKIYGDCVLNLHFAIYDRWGNIVFKTDNIDSRWNGLYKGGEMDSDIFFYTIDAELTNKEKISMKGNISLLR